MKCLLRYALCCALVSHVGIAAAAPIFSQTPTVDFGRVSDIDTSQPSQVVADDFSLGTAGSVRSVTWRGLYLPSNTNTPPPTGDDFTLAFYTSVSAAPGTLKDSFTIALGDLTRTDTGGTVSFGAQTLSIFEYTADLNAGIALDTETYWLSIYNNTSSDIDDQWAWARQGSLGNSRFAGSPTSTVWDLAGQEQYFILDDGAQSLPVTEPGTLSLAVLALIVLGIGSQRKLRT